MRSTAFQATFALLTLSANACTYADQPTDLPQQTAIPVQGVRVIPQVIQLSAVGETRQLIATISPANATDLAIVWESTDSSVASVGADGLVTARATGSGVFITAFTHDGQHEASVNVSVSP